MNSRKQVINEIAVIEKELHNQQIDINKHERYFAAKANNHWLALIAMLGPAFIAGWESGRQKRPGKMLKPLAKFALKFLGKFY